MNIGIFVRVAVMHTMMGSPPKDAFLPGGLRQKCHQELPSSPQLVASVAEVAVVSGRDTKHPHDVDRQHEPDPRPAERHEEHGNTSQMKEKKGNDRSETVVVQLLNHENSWLLPLNF